MAAGRIDNAHMRFSSNHIYLALHSNVMIRDGWYFYTSHKMMLDSCRPTQIITAMQNTNTGSLPVIIQWIQMLQGYPDKKQRFRIVIDYHNSFFSATTTLLSQALHVICEYLLNKRDCMFSESWFPTYASNKI